MRQKGLILLGFVIWLALFIPCRSRAESYTYYSPILKRNIFRPLWDIKKNTTSAAELERARLAEEQKQAELKAAEEKKQIEARKQELQKSLLLSGIVYNGKKYSALISDRRTGLGGNYQIGDVISDTKVISIDEANKTVILSDEGKFTIILKVGVSP